MADYTTQVKSICEFYAGRDSAGSFSDINNIISKARTHIFTEDYPIYAGGDKAALETKILKHYYMREIGFETVGLWKHFLNTRMIEIMPYYVNYMAQGVNSFNPEGTINLTKIYNETVNDSGNSSDTHEINTTTTTEYGRGTTRTGSERVDDDTTRTPRLLHTDKYSDTPQNELTDVENGRYLTNYRAIADNGDETINVDRTVEYQNVKDQDSGRDVVTDGGNTTDTNLYGKNIIRDTTDTTTGITSMHEYLDIKAKVLELIVNVDMMIISDLSDLFMRIY